MIPVVVLTRQHRPGVLRAFCILAFLAFAIIGLTPQGLAQGVQRIRFVTFNVDFANSANQVNNDIQAFKSQADIIMFQEAKWVQIANSFGSDFTVYHVTNQGDAKAGSALAFRNSVVTQVVTTGLRLGVGNNGEEMLDRYIAWADVKLVNGLFLRVMSLHMPPQRYGYLQPIMGDNLDAFVDESPYPVVVGADWNFNVNNDPHGIGPATGLTPKGINIDGFYYKAQVADFVSIAALSGLNVNSGHDPVKMVMDMRVPTYTMDNTHAGFSASGNWQTATSAADKYGSNYRFRSTQNISDPATWTRDVVAGTYKIYAWWSQGSNRSATAPHGLPDGQVVHMNQQTGGGQWNLLGTKALSGTVTTKVTCWTTSGFVVIADAVKYAP